MVVSPLSLGMLGAVVGGYLFKLFGIDFARGERKITFEDVIAAFFGSLLCLVVWWVMRKSIGPRKQGMG